MLERKESESENMSFTKLAETSPAAITKVNKETYHLREQKGSGSARSPRVGDNEPDQSRHHLENNRNELLGDKTPSK